MVYLRSSTFSYIRCFFHLHPNIITKETGASFSKWKLGDRWRDAKKSICKHYTPKRSVEPVHSGWPTRSNPRIWAQTCRVLSRLCSHCACQKVAATFWLHPYWASHLEWNFRFVQDNSAAAPCMQSQRVMHRRGRMSASTGHSLLARTCYCHLSRSCSR